MQADAHTIAVEQMRLGDHAFAHYADDDVRWQVPAVFTQRGLGHGEKVIIMGDPAVSAECDAVKQSLLRLFGTYDLHAAANPTNVNVPSGTTQVVTSQTLGKGHHLVQCCIHPWMRTVVDVVESRVESLAGPEALEQMEKIA